MKPLTTTRFKVFAAAGLLGTTAIACGGALAQSRPSGARSHPPPVRSQAPPGPRAHVPAVRGPVIHRNVRPHVFIGAPFFMSPWGYAPYPYTYGYDPYYYPPAVYVQEQPLEYMEQPVPPPTSAPPPQQYWYYCEASKTYYPYVQTCATPWQHVLPHAPQ